MPVSGLCGVVFGEPEAQDLGELVDLHELKLRVVPLPQALRWPMQTMQTAFRRARKNPHLRLRNDSDVQTLGLVAT